MQSIRTLSVAPKVNFWLGNSRLPRILHVFAHVCNLINEHREVLSIVTPNIGGGPFNLVVEDRVLFSEALDIDSPVSVSGDHLKIGDLTIITTGSKSWSPRPAWERLYNNREKIAGRLASFPIPSSQLPEHLSSILSSALAEGDVSSSRTVASRLAGWGAGLTPAGDDFTVGALYAAWIVHPLEVAESLAEEVAKTAAPLTTSLSAAWLMSAGKGEAGLRWHEFLDALILYDSLQIHDAIEKIMALGATSGTETLAGFIGTFYSYAEIEKKHVFPKRL